MNRTTQTTTANTASAVFAPIGTLLTVPYFACSFADTEEAISTAALSFQEAKDAQ